MTADEFVSKMRAIAPTVDELRREVTSQIVIDQELSTYLLKRRNLPVALEYKLGEIGKLIARYDVSKFDLCMVSFQPRIYIDAGAIVFGMEEADPIVMDPATREIRLQELGTNGFVLSRCAKNPESFLDGLYEVARFMARPCAERDRRGERRNAIGAAATAAGGHTYYKFYNLILSGFLDPA